jgi:ATP-binding cassette, subfamily F, member 3
MPLLAATNIHVTFGDRIILDGVSMSMDSGERVGVVGRNGQGKTTLFKVMAGMHRADEGSVVMQRGCSAGYLHQDPNLDPNETLRGAAEQAFAKLHALHLDLNKLYHDMTEASERGDHEGVEKILKATARVETEIEQAGGHAIDHKIDAVLHGLGFSDAQFNLPVNKLSGGQKGRLALAKLLLEEPDILLLDEPTNHLDIDGRLWLENFLTTEFKGAVLLISHDRYLLDAVVQRIVEVEQGRLIDYPGNYEAFREIRALRRLSQARAYENQATKFKQEQAFILRYKAGQRAKQARGRATRLERAKDDSTLERPMELAAFNIQLPKAPRTGDNVVSARGVSKKYPREDGTTKTLFHDLDLVINRGERWGIIGPNGAGKSTLVRCVLKQLEPDAGSIKHGSNLRIGYYSQLHEGLDREKPVYRYLQDVILKEAPEQAFSEQQARNLAGAFLFSGDEQQRDLGTLSGGERSRAVLAGLMASAKNLLILDEPTNHLDIPSAERLEMMLARPDEDGKGGGLYEGTLILISHDRAIIDATCDHLLILDGEGGARMFLGGYSEWKEKEDAQNRAASQRATDDRDRKDREERKRREADERKAREARESAVAASNQGKTANTNAPPKAGRPSRSGSKNPRLANLATDALEQKIATVEARLKAIDDELAFPETWKNHAHAQSLSQERQSLAKELTPLEEEWLRRAETVR